MVARFDGTFFSPPLLLCFVSRSYQIAPITNAKVGFFKKKKVITIFIFDETWRIEPKKFKLAQPDFKKKKPSFFFLLLFFFVLN